MANKKLLLSLLFSTTLCIGIAQKDTVSIPKRVIYTGLVNVASGDIKLPLIGFVNIAKRNHTGLEIGFLNIDLGQKSGFQFGMANYAKGHVLGSQIGFINLSDSVSNGISLAFLSLIKKGGYRALEVSTNEFYPFCIALKTGTSRFYSSLQIASGFRENDPLGFGLSFGTQFPLKGELILNPELGTYSSAYHIAVHFSSHLRYKILPKTQVFSGLALSWINGEQRNKSNLFQPLIPLRFEIDNQNKIGLGLRFGLSYELNPRN